MGGGLSRGGLLTGSLLRSGEFERRQSRPASFGSSRIGRVLVFESSFLLSVANGPPTKILYSILMVKTVLLPRVNRMVGHLDEKKMKTHKSIMHEDRAWENPPCCADESQAHHT